MIYLMSLCCNEKYVLTTPKERIICLNGEVDDTLSASIVAQLLFLEADNPAKPIHLYINSPGGSVTAGTRQDRSIFIPTSTTPRHLIPIYINSY